MTRPDEVKAPPFWAMYIGVPSLEDAAAQIKRLGGKRMLAGDRHADRRPHADDDRPAGRGLLHLPAGERTSRRPKAAPEVGEASWLELMTTDAPAALKLLHRAVRLAAERDAWTWAPMGKYHMFNRPHGMIGGMMNKPPELAHVPPNWQIYFRVPDIPAAIDRIKANGGQILNGPMEVPGGDWIVNAMDPQGAAFSLHAKKA